MEITTTKCIESSGLDELIKETYGRPYTFQQQNGCQSRGTHRVTVPDDADEFESDSIPEEVNGSTMGVTFAAWLARDPAAPVGKDSTPFMIELFWQRNFYPSQGIVLNDLHAKGLLAAGDYTVVIDW